MPPDMRPWIEVARVTDRATADDVALVLQSRGIDSVQAQAGAVHVVAVAHEDAPQARDEIARFLSENPATVPPPLARRPLGPGVLAALVYGAAMVGFHRLDLAAAGRADAAAIRGGAWWRAVTSLCLHADLPHLANNLLFGGLFGIVLAQSVGFGAAWTCFLLAGAAGNLLNALVQSPAHASVGASTGIFGMVGAQIAYEWMQRRRLRHGVLRRVAPLAIGVGLLAWLGGGAADRRVDVWAHVLGFVCGAALGAWIGARAGRAAAPPWAQQSLAAAVVAAVALSWILALRG